MGKQVSLTWENRLFGFLLTIVYIVDKTLDMRQLCDTLPPRRLRQFLNEVAQNIGLGVLACQSPVL